MNFSEQGQLQISCDNECVVACDWEIFSDRLAELFKIAVMHEYVVLNDTESLNAYGVPVVNMEVEASLIEQPCVGHVFLRLSSQCCMRGSLCQQKMTMT